MAGGKKSGKAERKAAKKARKAEKKARKAEKKAAKQAAKEAARLARRAAADAGVPAVPAAKRVRPRRAAPPKAAPVARKKVAPKRTVQRKATRRKAVRPPTPKPSAPVLKDRQQPESLRLRSAGPSFTVNDLQHSLVFYRDVLGFTVKERWEENGELRGVELVAGSVTFWLGQDDWKKGRDRVKGQGFRIYCGTTQDVDAIADRVRAAGVALLEEPKDQPWGGRELAVVDPDGFTISIASGI
jgi:uncharacterized glyoxalase superfamily protein PhnB